MSQSRPFNSLERVATVLRGQRRKNRIFTIAILGLGLFMLAMSYGAWFQTERGGEAVFIAIFALLAGLGMSGVAIYGLTRLQASIEADPVYTTARNNPGAVHTLLLTTTSDSESSWYLHILSTTSEQPLRTLEYDHANDARRDVALLQQAFPQATVHEQILK